MSIFDKLKKGAADAVKRAFTVADDKPEKEALIHNLIR